MMESINPATGQLLRTWPVMKSEQVESIIAAAALAQQAWARTEFNERAKILREAATRLRQRAPEYARLMAEEMGKPVRQGASEVEKCAWVCDYYAEHAAAFLQSESVASDARESYVCFNPLGVILAVMPWNFPLWQVFRFAAPALMAGNGALLKHASNVSGCGLAIEEIFHQAGIPRDLFRTLLIRSDAVESVISHPLVAAVSLTGSTTAGQAVAAAAGRHLKKCVLELGGSDPYVVLEDADVEKAASICVQGRMINTGQSCIAAKRFIVVEAVRQPFESKVLELMWRYKPGNPVEENAEIGPLARLDLREELHQQVLSSVEMGARLLLGGEIPPGPGAFYPPTLLTDVKPGMPAYEEEIFGPVAVIISVPDEASALKTANDTPFGLGAAIFTRDIEKGKRLAEEEIAAGSCFVNAFVRSDPRLPFGGIKQSGYGRELSLFGIREFINIKTVYVG